jgi:hypothetical protein
MESGGMALAVSAKRQAPSAKPRGSKSERPKKKKSR